jgi:sugar/nucleoside kinase (ribokinase family)
LQTSLKPEKAKVKKRMNYITGGGLRIDYLITHDEQAQAGLPGGNALFAAVGAAIWSDGVGLWARLGENYPQAWLLELARRGLSTAGLVRVPGYQDHRTFFAYTPEGRREDTDPAVHFARIGQPLPPELVNYIHSTPGQDDPETYEPLALRPEDWPAAYEGTTAIHLSPHSLRSHRFIPAALRRRGISCITLDPGERYMLPSRQAYLAEILPFLDAFLPSDQEIRSLFGEEVSEVVYKKAADQLAAWGARLVVIKRGAEGVLLREENGRFTHLRPYHQPGDKRVVDVTGAGDAFCGGFLVGLGQTQDPILAAKMGLVSASFVVEGYGALYALATAPFQAQARLPAVSQVR